MRVSEAIFAITIGMPCFLGVLSCTAAKTQSGEIVAVVTTDMVVPEDIDTLVWSVTISGDEAPLNQGSVDLKSKPLPATLAIVSGRDTSRPVRVQLDGSHAGASRVHREAQLTVPADGTVRQLAMPLNWLCTDDANPSLSCGAGQTCQGGECVPSAIDASALPAYTAPGGGACFDVGTCFAQLIGGGFVWPARPDPTTGQCVPTNYNGGADVNVALVVDTSQIGNYGACNVVGGQCLIPLARGSPDGWRALSDDGGAVTIGLPPGVCNDVGTTLVGVVFAQASATCPPKLLDSSTCAPPDTCIFSSGVCPDWGPDWVGYSCSGSAVPPPDAVQECFPPTAASDAGTDDAGTETNGRATGGRWCCGTGVGGQPGSLLIDDMSGGPQIKIAPPLGDSAGFWFTVSDDLKSPLLPVPLGLFTYTAVPPSDTPDGGPMNAACLTSPLGYNGFFAEEGFNFAWPKHMLSPGGVPFDVSSYTGIRFWAWSLYADQSITVSFPDVDTASVDPTSTCNQNPDGGQCGNDWAIQNLALTDTWAPYEIRWDQLTQATWGAKFPQFDAKQVFSTNFIVRGPGPVLYYPPFEFCVSQIYFTQ